MLSRFVLPMLLARRVNRGDRRSWLSQEQLCMQRAGCTCDVSGVNTSWIISLCILQ